MNSKENYKQKEVSYHNNRKNSYRSKKQTVPSWIMTSTTQVKTKKTLISPISMILESEKLFSKNTRKINLTT